MKSKKWVLSKCMKGVIDSSYFRLEEEDICTDLQDGEILVEAIYCSVDPYMRPYAERILTIGSTMVGEQISRVLCSKNPTYKDGELVLANIGWRTVTKVSDMTSIRKLPTMGDVPVSDTLGILGVTGLTAYYGLLEICQPVEGEVVVVSGAAGAVGSTAGQIAKIKGCKVIGICGSEEKCRWITENLGLDAAINYKTENIDLRLKTLAPDGIHCYFDNVGGDISSTVLHRMKLRGRVALCGTISLYHETVDEPTAGKQPYRAILRNQLRVEGFNVLRWFKSWSKGYADLLQWIQEGKLKSRQTMYEGFENMPTAFLGLFAGVNIGKSIVKVKD